MRIDFDFKLDMKKLEAVAGQVRKAMELGMNDVVDDLIRTSSDTTPILKGTLQKAWSRNVRWLSASKIEGTVGYRADEGGFNYALWTHEYDYKLGAESLKKPGGTGMSGKHYPVGNKYLTRPLEGEKQAYHDHIAKEIREELR